MFDHEITELFKKRFWIPLRLDTVFESRPGQIATEQLRAVDKSRLVKKLGRLRKKDQEPLLALLREMFA